MSVGRADLGQPQAIRYRQTTGSVPVHDASVAELPFRRGGAALLFADLKWPFIVLHLVMAATVPALENKSDHEYFRRHEV